MKMSTVTSSQLGTNCCAPRRFNGGECYRLGRCTYPEKATCKAYQTKTELLYRKTETFANGEVRVTDVVSGENSLEKPVTWIRQAEKDGSPVNV